MTKLLKSALVALLVTFCCTMKAETIRYATDEGFVYSLDTETQEASLNKYFVGKETEVVVPEFVTYEGNNYKVTSLGDECFYYSPSLTSIKIPASVTSLGNGCFGGCSLTSIEVPSSVTSLGDGCFSSCSKLETMVVDANNPVYDSREGCNAIIERESNTMIAGCKNTKIPSSVTSLGDYCFYGYSSLTAIEIPASVTSLGDHCFFCCSSLTAIEIPESVTSLGNGCFRGCSLTSVEVPSSVTSLGDGCFSSCSSLETMVVDANNPVYDSREGCNAIIERGSNTMIAGCKNTKIPSSVKSLGRSCFSGCSSLTAIEIPESVTSLRDWCFSSCSSLTAIEIPESVTSLGNHCFNGCSSLTSVEIPASVTSLGDYCFYGCSSLTAIEIPASVTSLGDYCFYGCSSLTAVEIPASVTSLGDYCFYGCSSLTAVEIPESVTSLGKSCFGGCSSLTAVEIPESVTSLGGGCFGGCSSLTAIEIPESVTSLGDFGGCSSLTAIEIPESVTSLGDFCFSGCSSLTAIEIPASVTSLGDYCFSDCSSLTSVEIPASVTSLGDYCFGGCSKLTSIEIPASVTSLGKGCFGGCSLTTIEIPSSVTSLGDYCFYNCSTLTSIEIPASVTSMGFWCFMNCSNLTSVVSKIREPFEMNPACFGGNPSTCTLTVPYGKREAYIAAGWTEEIFGGGIVEAPYNLATDNYLTLSDAEACKGCSVVLPVDMHNSEAITGLQFELSLPDGVTLSDCLLTARKGDHTVSYSQLANGNYQVVAISLSKQNFLGSEGVLLKLSLDVGDDVPSGDYPVIAKNIELTTSDTQPVNPDDVRATLSVSDVKIADANGDGRISITDAVAIVGHILGEGVEGFATAAADVNGDGKISITDAVAVIDMILDGNASAKTRDTRAWLDPQ